LNFQDHDIFEDKPVESHGPLTFPGSLEFGGLQRARRDRGFGNRSAGYKEKSHEENKEP
jgi:hypothetical protein